MRNPARIDRVLAQLREYWDRNPDLRLGQLVMNACRGQPGWPNIWNVEDEIVELGLQQMNAKPAVVGRRVISEPGAGIKITALELSDEAKAGLTVPAGVKIPPHVK